MGGNQVPRRLRDRERQRTVEDRGDDHHEEHPPPRLQAEPQVLAGSAGDVCKRIVDRQRQEDACDDRELLQGAQPASDAGRRRLGNVGRRDHRRHTDTDTADDSEDDEQPHAVRQAGAERADEEQHCGDLHDRYTPDPIGDAARCHRAGGGAEQRRRYGEAQRVVADAEVALDRGHRAIDDRAVIAEEEAAECGHRCDPDSGPARGEIFVGDRRRCLVDGALPGHEASFPQRCENLVRTTFPQSNRRHDDIDQQPQAERSPSRNCNSA